MASRRMRFFSVLTFSLVVALSQAAFAELVEYPWAPGLVYDTDQDVTWLKDANYAKTCGYDDGRMTWWDANTWVEDLVYKSGGVVYDDWRLPALVGCTWCYDNTTSEMGHLYYVDLKGTRDNPPETWEPFADVRASYYWSSAQFCAFDFGSGYQPGFT